METVRISADCMKISVAAYSYYFACSDSSRRSGVEADMC